MKSENFHSQFEKKTNMILRFLFVHPTAQRYRQEYAHLYYIFVLIVLLATKYLQEVIYVVYIVKIVV